MAYLLLLEGKCRGEDATKVRRRRRERIPNLVTGKTPSQVMAYLPSHHPPLNTELRGDTGFVEAYYLKGFVRQFISDLKRFGGVLDGVIALKRGFKASEWPGLNPASTWDI